MTEIPRPLNDDELKEWQLRLNEANRHNIFCHCRNCGEEWVDSFTDVRCKSCGSRDVEYIACWQFPDG